LSGRAPGNPGAGSFEKSLQISASERLLDEIKEFLLIVRSFTYVQLKALSDQRIATLITVLPVIRSFFEIFARRISRAIRSTSSRISGLIMSTGRATKVVITT
jgi:hypothetical protein